MSTPDPLAARLHVWTCRDNSPHVYVKHDGYSVERCRRAADDLREAGVVTKAEVVAAVDGLRLSQSNVDDIESMVLVDRANGVLDRVIAAIDRIGEPVKEPQ